MLLLIACTQPADTADSVAPHTDEPQDTSAPWTPPRVLVNEFMADNEGSLLVEEATPDWVELYNAGDRRVVLDGWGLSDDASEPGKQRLNGALEPGAWLLVLLDFGLAAEGEQVGLYAPGGAPVDRVDFGVQQPDVAMARSPDGGATWVAVYAGTPGASNQP